VPSATGLLNAGRLRRCPQKISALDAADIPDPDGKLEARKYTQRQSSVVASKWFGHLFSIVDGCATSDISFIRVSSSLVRQPLKMRSSLVCLCVCVGGLAPRNVQQNVRYAHLLT
jgi:hypothetical protein